MAARHAVQPHASSPQPPAHPLLTRATHAHTTHKGRETEIHSEHSSTVRRTSPRTVDAAAAESPQRSGAGVGGRGGQGKQGSQPLDDVEAEGVATHGRCICIQAPERNTRGERQQRIQCQRQTAHTTQTDSAPDPITERNTTHPSRPERCPAAHTRDGQWRRGGPQAAPPHASTAQAAAAARVSGLHHTQVSAHRNRAHTPIARESKQEEHRH